MPVALGDDVDACRNSIKPFLALYVGGMGAKGKNFYYDLACRYGFDEAANQVQDALSAGAQGGSGGGHPRRTGGCRGPVRAQGGASPSGWRRGATAR